VRRIVVGVKDRSSAAALRFAYDVARERGASLEVITVDRRGREADGTRPLGDAIATQAQLVAEEIGLGRLELAMTCDAIAGDPVDVLCGRAIGAELLVIGGRSRIRLRRWRRRPVVVGCVDRAPCALLVVRNDVVVPTPPPRGGVG
jgi:nucleotide-binding universal stress UspA family protein